MSKLVSGKVKKTPSTEVSSDRYNFISLPEVEPDLGIPTNDGVFLTSNTNGSRNWTDTIPQIKVTESLKVNGALYDYNNSTGPNNYVLTSVDGKVNWVDPIVFGKTPIKSVLFVQKNGNDTNNGESWENAFLTIERAMNVANSRGELTLIDVGPGRYMTRGHIDMPDNTILRCAHRTVVMYPEPGYEQRNVFRMGSGCFIEGFLFEDFQLDNLDNPTEGFAVSFRPGAVIYRVPYAHKIAVRKTPTWGIIAPPLDRANSNPMVGNGPGVALADGSVCSQYSVYPNIMTWGATPVTYNGIGYCAKNGGLINAVNAVSMWSHKHFYAIDGGQIILSSCSTQFGDYTMVSKGYRQILDPKKVTVPLIIQTDARDLITAASNNIINIMWSNLQSNGYTSGWTTQDEAFTRRDAATLLQCIRWVLATAVEKPMLDFAKGLFDTKGNKVYDIEKEPAFIYSFNNMRNQMIALPDMDLNAANIISNLISSLNTTLTNSEQYKRIEPSIITAIGHTWTGVLGGVVLTKIPPAKNMATIQESILELDQGVVIASGQDDQGSAIFIGGMKIDADTGELSGPPFDQAVNRISTRAAIARSF